MKKYGQFNVKMYHKHLRKTVKEMNKEDAYLMTKGVFLLWRNLNEYCKEKYGRTKRLDDLYNYLNEIQSAYLSKFQKEDKTPY